MRSFLASLKSQRPVQVEADDNAAYGQNLLHRDGLHAKHDVSVTPHLDGRHTTAASFVATRRGDPRGIVAVERYSWRDAVHATHELVADDDQGLYARCSKQSGSGRYKIDVEGASVQCSKLLHIAGRYLRSLISPCDTRHLYAIGITGAQA